MRVGIFDFMDCAHSVKALDGCDVPHGHTYKVEVVVEGRLQKDGVLHATDVLAKCGSRYEATPEASPAA